MVGLFHWRASLGALLVAGGLSAANASELSVSNQSMRSYSLIRSLPYSGPAVLANEHDTEWRTRFLCDDLFVRNRTLENAKTANLGDAVDGSGAAANFEIDVDRAARAIKVTRDGFSTRARYYEHVGCILLPPGSNDIYVPAPIFDYARPKLDQRGWAIGAQTPLPPPPKANSPLAKVFDRLFVPENRTSALIVVRGNKLIAERYAAPFTADTLLTTASIAKGIGSLAIGVLNQQRHLAYDGLVPIAEWRKVSDYRSRIKVSDLMLMQSGLESQDTAGELRNPPIFGQDPRHIFSSDRAYSLRAGANIGLEAIETRGRSEPGTVMNYTAVEPLLLGYFVYQQAVAEGIASRVWLQKNLFDRLEIETGLVRTDAYGHLDFNGHAQLSARDFTKLGLLLLRNGDWYGDRVLTEDFVTFVQKPSPAWWRGGAARGAGFMLNGKVDGTLQFPGLPTGAYYSEGHDKDFIIVIPEWDMVVGRFGDDVDSEATVARIKSEIAEIAQLLRK